MKFVYTPEGASPRSWDFEPNKLFSPEAEAIEDVTGRNFNDAIEAATEGNMKALRALLWIFLKREIPGLKFSEVSFSASEIDVELSDEETRQALEVMNGRLADGAEFDAKEQQLYEALVAAAADITPPVELDDPDAEMTDDPKGTVTAETSTGGSSRTSSTARRRSSTA